MRILIDAHQLGMQQTGNETWVRNIVRHIEPQLRGHELHVAVTEQGLSELRRLTGARCHVVSARAVRRVALDIPRLIARERVDALLAQYTVAPSRAALVVMVHDLSPLDPAAHQWLSSRFRLRFRASLAMSTRVATSVLAPSHFTARRLIEEYGLEHRRVMVAPNAIDDDLAVLLDSGRRVKPPIPTVLSVGNVLPRKNLTTVAAAVRQLRRQGVPIRYRIAGQVGPGGAAIARELREIVPDVEITGYVSTERLAQHYLSASVLAFPSLYEGFGVPIVEAMRAHLPVICSDSTSLPEVAGGACALVPARGVDAWKAAIQSLTSDEAARRRLIRRGTARARQFDWESSARVVAGALVSAGASRRPVATPAMVATDV